MLKESVTPILVDHYVDLLSCSWRQRNRLFSSYQHGYLQLVEWDKYITHYLNGLLLLANEADSCIQDRISESILNKGDVFAIALYALALNRDDYLHALLTLAYSISEYDEAVRDIILWAPEHAVLWTILQDYPLYHAYALTVRQDITLRTGINLHSLSVTKPSVMTVGSLAAIYRYNINSYFSFIESLLDANDAARLVAIESLLDNNAFYSYKQTIQNSLYQLTQSPRHHIAEKAAELTVLKSPLPVDDYLTFIRQDVKNHRLTIKALGWYGHAGAIPELIERMDTTAFARLSAAALYTITGSAPENEGWAGDAPPPALYALPRDADGFVPEDPDAGLTWPDSAAFSVWWEQHRADFNPHQCYLAGKNTGDRVGLASVVLTQSLPLSCLAAIRLSTIAAALSERIRLPAYAGPPHQLTDSMKA